MQTRRGPRSQGPPAADFFPLSPATHPILPALADEERHGDAVTRGVARLAGGATPIGPGTLYGTLERLLDSALVEKADERPDPALGDERWRYYRITPLCARVLQAESARLAALLDGVRARNAHRRRRRLHRGAW